MIELQPVNSSLIDAIGHHAGVMHIRFKNGKVYEYIGPKVSEHYAALLAAPSIGKHFGAHVRGCPATTCGAVS